MIVMSVEQINMSLYDRQVRTFGVKASQNLSKSRVYLYGLEGGLGGEIAKNLALSGIKELYLHDAQLINNNDIDSSYYYQENDMGKSRSDVLKTYLQQFLCLVPMLFRELTII